jgi:hypothetical protein
MDSVFANAFCLPPTPTLLGRKLLPFSLGHSLLLESIESPVMDAGAVMPGELAVALWICSRPAVDPATEHPPAVDRDAVAAEFDEWGRRTPRDQLAEALVIFRAYLAAFTEAPRRWESGKAGAAPASPWQYAVVNALREHLHCGYAAAWNTPVNRALAEYATLGEAHGDTSVMSADECREAEEVERADEPTGARRG